MVLTFAWLAGICLVWKIAAGIVIVRRLEKRGMPINYWGIRLMVYSYAWQYRAISRQETGSVAGAFYHFWVPAVLMWVFVVVALVLHAS
jgi:hypothetical protein